MRDTSMLKLFALGRHHAADKAMPILACVA
jgi:hypothetical protein